MRYLVGFVCVLALVGSPLSVGAQDNEAGTTSEPAPKEPALQLQLDDAGVEAVPSAPRTSDGYTLEDMEIRVRRAKIGLGVSAGVLVLGGALLGAAGAKTNTFTGESMGLLWAGSALAGFGFVGTVVAGGMFAHRKRKLRRLQEAHYERPRRVQWDLARSRPVF